MQMTEFLRALDELLELEPGTLRSDSRIEDFGWNSLAALGFIAFADQQFGAEVPAGSLAQCETVSDLAALLGGRIGPPAGA
jgi:acyl carrier protein